MDFEIREERKPQGPHGLVAERAAYFQLMEQGYSTREAARIVGINLRTGKRWRNGWHAPGKGKKAVPPIYPQPGETSAGVSEEPPLPSRYLRGMRTASVARGEGARLAAAVSLVLASAKIRDHVLDGDGLLRRRPMAVAARRVARGWDEAAARGGAGLGFDTGSCWRRWTGSRTSSRWRGQAPRC